MDNLIIGLRSPDTVAERITVLAIVYSELDGHVWEVCVHLFVYIGFVSVCFEGQCSTCDVDSAAAAPAPVT